MQSPPRPRRGTTGRTDSFYDPAPGFMPALQRFLRRTHAADYLGLIALALFDTALFIPEPFHRLFSLDDRRISYPHAEKERVPVTTLLILTILGPLSFIVAFSLMKQKGSYFMQVSLLGLATSLLGASFFTDFVKNTIGRPRPDLISRCLPKKDTPLHELVSWTVCTQTSHHTLHDGWRSFPSGHSSSSFAGLGYLSLFVSGQIHTFHRSTSLAAVCFSASFAFLALYISISRLEDYRHDYADVGSGICIGTAISYLSYRRYFPSLRRRNCDVPHDIDEDVGRKGSRSSSDLENEGVGGSVGGGGGGAGYESVNVRGGSVEMDRRRREDLEMGGGAG